MKEVSFKMIFFTVRGQWLPEKYFDVSAYDMMEITRIFRERRNMLSIITNNTSLITNQI